MNDTLIGAQYSTGLSRRNIERALVAAGKDIDHSPESALPTRSGWT
jgi:sarcosine/dimethylglycine N-methyltransferase